ncbi:MAG: succinate dehydrogenase, hydrophobic membrane anchor protein [Rhizobiaceae bacterium]|nr:succinate dehydrogenase, hydrophobic membrane anchor protein [Rhizobiaceae bacterium]
MSEMRTTLKTVRGLGSAKDGTMHFWLVRISSVALVPLTLFAIGLVFSLIGKDYDAARAVVGQPLVAVLLILFVAISIEHMRLGIQETIVDYIHGELLKVSILMLNTAFSLVLGAVSVFALLKLAFGG